MTSHSIRSCILASLTGTATFTLANVASAATPCNVPLDGDPVAAAAKLEECIKIVNLAAPFDPTPITFEGPQVYEIDTPLEITRDMYTDDTGLYLQPSPNFEGESLVIIGCQDCSVETTAEFTGLHLNAGGLLGVRGMDVRANHHAVLTLPHFVGFDVPDDGACIRAGQQSSLTVAGGVLRDCVAAGQGGAIFSEASLTAIDGTKIQLSTATLGGGVAIGDSGVFPRFVTVQDAIIEDNAASDQGGGLWANASQLTASVSGTRFASNTADGNGGGFYGKGTVTDCRFEANTGRLGGGAFVRGATNIARSSFDDNDAYRGGGIAVLAANNANVSIAESTIANNAALFSPNAAFPYGGGVYVGRATGNTSSVTTITNSTLSGNSVDLGGGSSTGGGLGVQSVAVVVEHTTIQDNSAGDGGGIYAIGSSASVTLLSSIVAGSTGGACTLGTVGFVTDTSLDDDGTCGVAFPNIDPQLGSLADNTGPTWTHLPASANVLGTASCYSAKDQRGLPRPASGCDIGSVQQ